MTESVKRTKGLRHGLTGLLLLALAGCAGAPALRGPQNGEPMLYTVNGYYLGVWNGDTLECWDYSDGNRWEPCAFTPPMAVPEGTRRILTNSRRTAIIDGERRVRFLAENGTPVPYCEAMQLPAAADQWEPMRGLTLSTECELSYRDGAALLFVSEEEGMPRESRQGLTCDIPRPDRLYWYWVKWELAAIYPDRVTIPRIALVDGKLLCVEQAWKTLPLPERHDEVLVFGSDMIAVRTGARVVFFSWDEKERKWIPARRSGRALPAFVIPSMAQP